MNTCRACGRLLCEPLIDFGPQPVCHHFVDEAHAEKFHPQALELCSGCGVVQTVKPVPPEELVPHYDWISYNEPEAHLDAMVAMLSGLPGLNPQSALVGLSYKEDSTLRRFREHGFTNTRRLDAMADLDIARPGFGMETIQARLTVERTKGLRKKHGAANLVIARHILEHTHDTAGFLAGLRELVGEGGYLVFEVPDCARAFDLLDYTTLWEDHTLYFVEETYLRTLARHGLQIVRFERYQAPYENCLVAVATPVVTTTSQDEPAAVERERKRARGFASGLEKRRNEVREFLGSWRKRGPVALMGAGHLAVVYINALGLADLIDFVIDDHPEKRGRRMPGSRLPILGSEALREKKVALCLTSLGAESEAKVVRKQQAFVEAGGTFASIFPVRKGELVNVVAGDACLT